MYIKDDICYAGELTEGIQVTEARPLRGGMMLVTFSTGEKRIFDTTLLEGDAFKPLSDEEIFSHPGIFDGVITWNNGEIDLPPETVYRDSYPYNSEEIITASSEQTPHMSAEDAKVTAWVDPEIKRRAEAILDQLGVSVSDLIEALYRQIIMTGKIPFPLDVPTLPARGSLTAEQFNAMMETGVEQAKAGDGLPLDEVMEKIREEI